MKIFNKSINQTLNGMCIVLYTKDFERTVFYCAAVSPTKDGRSRFYIRNENNKIAYRVVLRDSDFLLVHAIVWHGGSFKVESGYLVDLHEYDLKLILDFASGTII